ncbi:MAG TPA: peptidoglycan editing factor PgeF [Mycobacteriales bacterium]|nr:peptidoglycan editing factor PgeF [Mycobacteriales bacterium]
MSDRPGPGLLDAGLPGVAAGVFTTRAGGTSRPPWDQLDLGLHVGDDPDRVRANRELVRAAVGGPRLAYAEQVHGRGVAVLAEAGPDPVPGVDALVTATPGLGLVVLAADCLPVLLADAEAGVVAAAHAGRAGLAGGVLEATLVAMAGLGADAGTTCAVLGPAVCGGCYELPEQLADEVGRRVPGSRSTTRQGTPGVDLAAGAEAVLRAAGLASVTRTGGCTLEQPERFYSYRRDGVTGRHAGVVWLRP